MWRLQFEGAALHRAHPLAQPGRRVRSQPRVEHRRHRPIDVVALERRLLGIPGRFEPVRTA